MKISEKWEGKADNQLLTEVQAFESLYEKHKQENYKLGVIHGIEKAVSLVERCDTIVGVDRHGKPADTGVFRKSVVLEVLKDQTLTRLSEDK